MGPVCRSGYSVSRNKCTAVNAIRMRHCKKRPKVTRDFKHSVSFARRVREQVLPIYMKHLDFYTEEWINKWPKKKQEAIRTEMVEGRWKPRSVKAFIKYECQHAKPTKGRLIQGYGNLYTQWKSAVRITSIQKAYCEFFDASNKQFNGINITIGSGLNFKQYGVWMEDAIADGCTHFYERDGKSWDSTMGRTHHKLKQEFFGLDKELVSLIEQSYKTTGNVRTPSGNVRYSVKGTTRSGHNDTTIGNSLINAMIAYEAMLTHNLKGWIIVAGDDLLVCVKGDFDEHALAKTEACFGIVPEYAKFESPFDVSFVSAVWYPTTGGLSFGPKPGRQLAKLFWTTKPPGKKYSSNWYNSVCTGLLMAFEDCPIMDNWVRKMKPGGDDESEYRGKIDYYFNDYVKAENNRGVYMDYLLYKYGIAESEVLECEKFIDDLEARPSFVKHPTLDIILNDDLADVDKRPKTY